MIRIRKAGARGHANWGWLDAHHTFSFARYYDPAHMGFRTLRVINEDRVAPEHGFDTHPHDNMEIVTFVLEGAIRHADSMGHTEILRAGEVQRMSAGTGITHSEVNPSSTDPLHLYQVWILPAKRDIEPSYEQKAFPKQDRQNRWQTVVAPDGQNGAMTINQDARILLANLDADSSLDYELAPGRGAWLQVVSGELSVNGERVETSDGVAIEDERTLTLRAATHCEVILFDLA